MKDSISVLCNSLSYFSMYDEDMFFMWLRQIPCVLYYIGQGRGLTIYINSKHIPDNDILNLICLFKRYSIEDIEQLEFFKNEENKHIFEIHMPSLNK
jgi:hypothetical protein